MRSRSHYLSPEVQPNELPSLTLNHMQLVIKSSRLIHNCRTPFACLASLKKITTTGTTTEAATPMTSMTPKSVRRVQPHPPSILHPDDSLGSSLSSSSNGPHLDTATEPARATPLTTAITTTTIPQIVFPILDTSLASSEDLETWSSEFLSSFVTAYVGYLETFGLCRLEVTTEVNSRARSRGAVPPTSAGDDLRGRKSPSPSPARTASSSGKDENDRQFETRKGSHHVYMYKILPEGLFLVLLWFQEIYVCCDLYAMPSPFLFQPGFGIQFTPHLRERTMEEANRGVSLEAMRLKDILHLNSFVYDFHLRKVSKFLAAIKPRAIRLAEISTNASSHSSSMSPRQKPTSPFLSRLQSPTSSPISSLASPHSSARSTLTTSTPLPSLSTPSPSVFPLMTPLPLPSAVSLTPGRAISPHKKIPPENFVRMLWFLDQPHGVSSTWSKYKGPKLFSQRLEIPIEISSAYDPQTVWKFIVSNFGVGEGESGGKKYVVDSLDAHGVFPVLWFPSKKILRKPEETKDGKNMDEEDVNIMVFMLPQQPKQTPIPQRRPIFTTSTTQMMPTTPTTTGSNPTTPPMGMLGQSTPGQTTSLGVRPSPIPIPLSPSRRQPPAPTPQPQKQPTPPTPTPPTPSIESTTLTPTPPSPSKLSIPSPPSFSSLAHLTTQSPLGSAVPTPPLSPLQDVNHEQQRPHAQLQLPNGPYLSLYAFVIQNNPSFYETPKIPTPTPVRSRSSPTAHPPTTQTQMHTQTDNQVITKARLTIVDVVTKGVVQFKRDTLYATLRKRKTPDGDVPTKNPEPESDTHERKTDSDKPDRRIDSAHEHTDTATISNVTVSITLSPAISFPDFKSLLDLVHKRPAEEIDPTLSRIGVIDSSKTKDLASFLTPLYSASIRKFDVTSDHIHLVIFNSWDSDLFLYLTTERCHQRRETAEDETEIHSPKKPGQEKGEKEQDMFHYSYNYLNGAPTDNSGNKGLFLYACRRFYDPKNKEHDAKEAKHLSSLVNSIVQFIWREIFS